MQQPTRTQQVWLWSVAAIIGLGLGEILHAGDVGSVALVAGVGILIGIGFAATQRSRGESGDDRD